MSPCLPPVIPLGTVITVTHLSRSHPDLPEPEPHFDLTHQRGICDFFNYMRMELEKMLYSSGFFTAITLGNIVLGEDNESYDPFKMKVRVPIELDPSKLTIEEMEKAQDILTTKVMYLCNKHLYGHCCAYMKFDVKCEVTIKAPPPAYRNQAGLQ